MKVFGATLLNAQSLAASAQSSVVDMQGLFVASLVYTVTGTAGGTLTIQASNDPADLSNGQSPTNWATVGTAITISATGSFLVNLADVGYKYLRLNFASGGTGTITANFFAKGA